MKKMMFGLSVVAAVLFASAVFAQEKPQKNSDEKAPPRSERMEKRGPEQREFKGNRDEGKKDEWKRDGKRDEWKKEGNREEWKKGERGPEHFQGHKGHHRGPDFDKAPCDRCPMKAECPRADFRKGDGPRDGNGPRPDFKAQRPEFAGHGMPFMSKDGSIEIKKIIAFFEKMDADHDGIITKEERADFHKKMAKKFDRDNDGPCGPQADHRGPQANQKRGPKFDPENCPFQKGDCPAQVKKDRKPNQDQKVQKPEMKKEMKKDHKPDQAKKAPRPEMKKDRPAPEK